MNLRHLAGGALGALALLLAPSLARAGSIQYIFVSGSFSYSAGVLSGDEHVNITDLMGNAITLHPPFTPFNPVSSNGAFKLHVATSGGIVSGSLTDKLGATLFNFSGGTLSTFATVGNNAVFAVSNITYSNVAPQLNQPQYLRNGSKGSFTGSTTSWNGGKGQGKFNGQFSANTPELGSSVVMATMLVGAGFLGFRKRR